MGNARELRRRDGGLWSLVWTDSESCSRIMESLAPNQKIATEKDVMIVPELKTFLEG